MIQPANDRRKAATLAPVPAANGFSSYPPEEVTFLVKDLSGVLVEVTRAEYEEGINQGRHYAEMLPEEEYPADSRGPQPFRARPEPISATTRAGRRNHH